VPFYANPEEAGWRNYQCVHVLHRRELLCATTRGTPAYVSWATVPVACRAAPRRADSVSRITFRFGNRIAHESHSSRRVSGLFQKCASMPRYDSAQVSWLLCNLLHVSKWLW